MCVWGGGALLLKRGLSIQSSIISPNTKPTDINIDNFCITTLWQCWQQTCYCLNIMQLNCQSLSLSFSLLSSLIAWDQQAYLSKEDDRFGESERKGYRSFTAKLTTSVNNEPFICSHTHTHTIYIYIYIYIYMCVCVCVCVCVHTVYSQWQLTHHHGRMFMNVDT